MIVQMDQRSGILRLQKKHPDTSAGIFPVHLLPAFYIFHHKMQHRVHYQVHDTGFQSCLSDRVFEAR